MNSQSRASIMQTIKKEKPYLRERFGVERLALFGSFARGDADESSDIDIAVVLRTTSSKGRGKRLSWCMVYSMIASPGITT